MKYEFLTKPCFASKPKVMLQVKRSYSSKNPYQHFDRGNKFIRNYWNLFYLEKGALIFENRNEA